MTLCTRGLGSKNLIPTSGLGAYDGTYTPPAEESSGGRLKLFSVIGDRIREDVEPRLFDDKEKLITVTQVLKALPKKAITQKVKEIKRELDVLAPEARELIALRIKKQIEAMRLHRISELNQEAIALIMISIVTDDY